MSTGKSALPEPETFDRWTAQPRFSGPVLTFFLILVLALFCDVITAASSAANSRPPAALPTSSPATAASPAPGIAFDEIARFIKADATPPPIGTFDADAATIAALPPLSLP